MNASRVIANLAGELGGRRGVYAPVHPSATSTWGSPPAT
jgi:aspartate ammonia-lyase